jgi:hypothetical protein
MIQQKDNSTREQEECRRGSGVKTAMSSLFEQYYQFRETRIVPTFIIDTLVTDKVFDIDYRQMKTAYENRFYIHILRSASLLPISCPDLEAVFHRVSTFSPFSSASLSYFFATRPDIPFNFTYQLSSYSSSAGPWSLLNSSL